MNFQQYMMQAIELGKKNPRAPFGAVIIDRDSKRILAEGVNDGAFDATAHGEMVALHYWAASGYEQDGGEVVLFTTAEPCPMCAAAIIWAGVDTVVWGAGVEDLKKLGWNQFNDSCQAMADRWENSELTCVPHVLRQECIELFS